jgi:putative transposase
MLTEHGVQVAPRTYRNWKNARPSDRAVTDAYLTDALRATANTPEGMYGRRKMTAHLRRRGHRVAACTIDRLMRDEGLSGLVRGGNHRTTAPQTRAVGGRLTCSTGTSPRRLPTGNGSPTSPTAEPGRGSSTSRS